MYADRVEAGTERSLKERLNGNTVHASGRRRQITGKRQRQDDDKWEHDLYQDGGPQVSNRRVSAKDLRLKLQRKRIQQATQSGTGSLSRGVKDLREKLSSNKHPQAVKSDLPKPNSVPEGSKPAKKHVIVETPVPQTKKIGSSISRKKAKQKPESADAFLQSLGLEKYSVIFQAEEVDMTALVHMTNEDLKAMGIPMGPRKKILSALDSKT
ncbi:uncharacterized protein LOC132306672 [Cornus florida]|uniref:uncharacterized protein LOC132306672 n=1 Tax=Cornus florida TaxID=4283 RepID=UPI00289980B4|nr:uncharacterized protein LOC132306672 [Cornus florida]